MTFAAVQRKIKGSAGAVASLSIGSGDGWVTPSAGNLLVASGNSDATLTMTTAGFTAGPSIVDGNGAYLWYKIAAGTESTVTITPGSSAHTVLSICEYSGNAASPFDAQNSSLITSAFGSSTNSAAVSSSAAGDLVFVSALIHSINGTALTGPAWSNSFTQQLAANTGGVTSSDCYTYIGDQVVGAAGSYSSVCTWTATAADRQHLIMAFKAATVSAPDPVFRRRPHSGLYLR